MPAFWQNWIKGWCGTAALFGIVLAGGAFEATSGPVRIVFDLLNGPGDFDLDPPMRFSLGVLGAVSIGWSLTLLTTANAANQLDRKLAKPIWIQVIGSVLAWYLIDSLLSVATGFGLNVIPNTILLAGFLFPVIRSGVLR
jgi:hypothetical protein